MIKGPQPISSWKGILLCILFFAINSAQAIVNIESLRPSEDHQGFAGQMDFKMNGSGGNTDKLNLGFSSSSVWQQKQHHQFLILDYLYGESGDIKDTNRFLSHARSVHDLVSAWLDWEVFVQWQSDEFKRLNSRFLSGGGFRSSPWREINFSTHIGVGAFWYQERLSKSDNEPSRTEDSARANFYVALNYLPTKNWTVATSLYFQPRFDGLKDHLLLWESIARFKFSEFFSFIADLKVVHDNLPPVDVKTTDTTYMVGFGVTY